MANAPMGDIELVLNRDSLSYNGAISMSLKGKDKLPSMRIRFSRQQCFLEFAQHIVETRGSEWKKRVKAFTGDFGLLLLEDDLSDLERKAIHLLTGFLQTCQKLEELSVLDMTGKFLNSVDDCLVLQGHDDCASVCIPASLKADTNWLHSRHKSEYEAHITEDVLSQPSASIFETRFIHSAGWCIKRLGKESSKAVYNVLFLDGTSITIDGVQVEFTAQSGEISRLNFILFYQQNAWY